MNRPSHRQALLAGLAIILGVNAIALGGAAWNRSREDSRLRLSERELALPYAWQGNAEDSGVALALQWQAASGGAAELGGWHGAELAWLDAGKLAQLGFDLRPPTVRELEKQQWRGREREVLAVLELAGPAYARALADADRDYQGKRAEYAASPPSEELQEKIRENESRHRDAHEKSSRLFVVDAGLDRDALRRRYPDRRRYALAPALVRMQWQLDKGRMRPSASVSRLLNEQLHLSNTLASAIAPALADSSNADGVSRRAIEAEIAFGRRLEPWVVDARLRAAARP